MQLSKFKISLYKVRDVTLYHSLLLSCFNALQSQWQMYCRIDSWIRAYLCVKFGEDHT